MDCDQTALQPKNKTRSALVLIWNASPEVLASSSGAHLSRIAAYLQRSPVIRIVNVSLGLFANMLRLVLL